ncbi:hypothetical protein D3C85_1177300 [compost metagenome]
MYVYFGLSVNCVVAAIIVIPIGLSIYSVRNGVFNLGHTGVNIVETEVPLLYAAIGVSWPIVSGVAFFGCIPIIRGIYDFNCFGVVQVFNEYTACEGVLR